jgi:hypothetical protein
VVDIVSAMMEHGGEGMSDQEKEDLARRVAEKARN